MERRTFLKAGGAAVGAASLGAITLHETAQPTLAASLTASNVSATTDDGQITSIAAAPSLTIDYGGFDEAIDQFEIGLFSKLPSESSFLPADDSGSGSGYVALAQLNSASTGGTRDVTLAELALRSGSNTEAIDADTDGNSNSTDVTMKVVVQAADSTESGSSYQGNKIVAKTEATATYTVSVTNQAASVSASGTANTSING